MKRMKRFLAALLCVCLLTGLMVTSASAANVLSKVDVTIDGPVIGEVPAKTAKLDSASTRAGCYVKSVKWSGTLNQWDKFQGGETYTATITLGIKGQDTTFADTAFDAKVNGVLMDEVTMSSDNKELVIEAEFEKTKAPTIIDTARLTITPPAAGKNPSTISEIKVPADAPYFVFKVNWKGGMNGGKFKEGTEYTALVTLQIHSDKNTWFSDKSFNAYVNGQLIDEIEWNTNTEIVVPVEFTATASSSQTTSPTVLKEAKITLTAPEAGKTPATTAKVPSGADYTVKKVEWKGSLSSGKFKENTAYTAYVTLGIKSGKNATFSDKSFDAYVNDYLIDEVTWNSATEIVVPVEFEKTGAAQTTSSTVIKEARIGLTGPEAGKTPATTATVPSGADYTVKKVTWKGSLSSGKFKANTTYTAEITLGIKSGKNATLS